MAIPRVDELAELLKVMTHDLRNPLSALLTNLHFLQTSLHGLEPDLADALADSVSLCDVLDRLIANVDVLAKSEDPRMSNRFPTSLRQIAQAVVARQRHQVASAGLEIVLDEGGSDALALVERDMFSRAFENLVANAVEHAPPGSRIEIQVRRGEAEASVAVRDGGAGVSPELRKRAVSIEGQTRGARQTDLRYGRGLGLLCADLAARAAGARLELDGDADGSVLRLIAPIG